MNITNYPIKNSYLIEIIARNNRSFFNRIDTLKGNDPQGEKVGSVIFIPFSLELMVYGPAPGNILGEKRDYIEESIHLHFNESLLQHYPLLFTTNKEEKIDYCFADRKENQFIEEFKETYFCKQVLELLYDTKRFKNPKVFADMINHLQHANYLSIQPSQKFRTKQNKTL